MFVGDGCNDGDIEVNSVSEGSNANKLRNFDDSQTSEFTKLGIFKKLVNNKNLTVVFNKFIGRMNKVIDIYIPREIMSVLTLK